MTGLQEGKLAIDVAWKTEVKELIAQLGVSLWSACNQGDVGAVKTILSAGTVEINKPNADGSSPLWIACRHGHLDVVKLLLARKDCIIDFLHTKQGSAQLSPCVFYIVEPNDDVPLLLLFVLF